MISTLAFFPEIYEDELLYSALGRYHQMVCNGSFKATLMDLFGTDTVCSVTDLPSHLGCLSQRVSGSRYVDPLYLLAEHTLLPYYDPFLPVERFHAIRESMIGDRGGAVHFQAGIVASTVTSPGFLRYCIECALEDEKTKGVPFWHRVHQLPGVLICPHHCVLLRESRVTFSSRQQLQQFQVLNLENELHVNGSLPANVQQLLFIAKESQWLLKHDCSGKSLSEIKDFYIARLAQRGFITGAGRVRFQDLLPKFISFYGIPLLHQLQSLIDVNDNDTWLHKVLRKPRVTCHPLRHILLMGFLHETAVSLFGDSIHAFPGLSSSPESLPSLRAPMKKEHDNVAHTLSAKKRAYYREKWMLHITNNPIKSRTELRNLDMATYAWLYRHDRNWLMETPNSRQIPRDKASRVDWKQRDRVLKSLVAQAAKELRAMNPPIRITKSRIGRHINHLSWLEKHLEKMPETREVMGHLTESVVDFQVRRVQTAAVNLRSLGTELRHWRLVREAGLRPGYEVPVEIAILQEMESLRMEEVSFTNECGG